MKKKHIILLALTIALIFATSINGVMAYFTTYARAEGGYTIHLSGSSSSSPDDTEPPKSPEDKNRHGSGNDNGTEMWEEFSAWTKHVTVVNDQNNQPVYVRIKAFSGSMYQLTFLDDTGFWTPGSQKVGDKWVSDGFYYYNKILYPGQTTEECLIRIENVPADVVDGDGFNVVVIYETTPVQYDEDGNPYADWSLTLTTQ